MPSTNPLKPGNPAGWEIPAPQKNTTRPSSCACKSASGMSGPLEMNCIVRLPREAASGVPRTGDAGQLFSVIADDTTLATHFDWAKSPLRDIGCLLGQGQKIPLVMKAGVVEFNTLGG